MDFATLRQLLDDALASPPVTLTGAYLESPPITALFTNFFGADAMQLSNAVPADAPANTYVLTATLGERLVALESLAVTATFTVDAAGVAQLTMLLTNVPAAWKPSASFAALADTMFDMFAWSNVSLTLDSTGGPPLPADFPSGYGFPAYDDSIRAAMIYGLSLSATVARSEGFDSLPSLLGASTFEVRGPVVLPESQLSIDLGSAALPGTTIAGYAMPFALHFVSGAIVYADDQDVDQIGVSAAVQLVADVEKTVGTTTLTIPVRARYNDGTDPNLTLIADLESGGQFDIANIAELLAGESIAGQIPDSFPALDAIELSQVAVRIDSASLAVLALGVTIKYVNATPWTPFESNSPVVFDDLAITFTWFPASTTGFPIATTITARASVVGDDDGTGVIAASASLPDVSLACTLESGTINLKALVESALGGAIQMPQVTCTQLNLYGAPLNKRFRFQADISSDWSFDIGTSEKVVFRELSFDFTIDPSGFTGEALVKLALQLSDSQTVDLFGRTAYSGGAWQFQVGTLGEEAIDVGQLIAALAKMFGSTASASNVSGVFITAVNLECTTATGSTPFTWTFFCAARLEMLGQEIDLGLEIGTGVFSGYIWLNDEEYFGIDYSSNQTKTLTATWTSTNPLGINDILAALKLDAPPEIPPDLDLALKGATLTYDFTTGDLVVTCESVRYGNAILVAKQNAGTRIYFAGFGAKPIPLSALPIVGEKLDAAQSASIENLSAIFVSQVLTQADAQPLAALTLLHPTYPQVPAMGMPDSKMGMTATLNFAGSRIPFALGMTNPAQAGGVSNGNTSLFGSQTGTASGAVAPQPPAASDGTLWVDVQKAFGPITIDKLGLRYADGTIWFLVTASLNASALSITLIGASIGVSLSDYLPKFELLGLGIALDKPPLRISGSFARVLNPKSEVEFQYDGSVAIQATSFGLAGVGSYAVLKPASEGGPAMPSMFLFAEAMVPIGGPPIFFVTGLLAGFGFNSNLRIPARTEIVDFPFVAGIGKPEVIGGAGAPPADVLLTLRQKNWVAPQLGQIWLAAGVKFRSFELVDSTALFIAEFGNELTLALLGLSTARFPQDPAQPAYAVVQLQLEALLQPQRGVFQISAELTRNSFLIDPSCVLTGGFAFWFWFGENEYAGDFVITIGGYNAAFAVPAHYPREPRVGFTWKVDTRLTISGQAYFALTPSAIMAGGALGVVFVDGNLRAWLVARADLIIWWKPFKFRVEIAISIGVSYRANLLFTTTTINVELSASLLLTGPPTAGIVKVKLWIVSFTVEFGAIDEAARQPLPWTEFQTLLPASDSSTKFVASNGMLAEQPLDPSQPDGAKRWLVRNDAFTFTGAAAFPLTSLVVTSEIATSGKVNILPMQKTDVTSTLTVTITHEGAGYDPIAAGWTASGVTSNIPRALWGTGLLDDTRVPNSADQLVRDQLTGFSLVAPSPKLGDGDAKAIDVEKALSFLEVAHADTPVFAGPEGDLPQVASGAVGVIYDDITSTGAVAARAKLFDALKNAGIDAGRNDALDRFRDAVPHLYTAAPLIVPKGTT